MLDATLRIIAMVVAVLACATAQSHDVHDGPHTALSRNDDPPHAFTGERRQEQVEQQFMRFRATGDDRLLDEAWRLIEPELRGRPHDPDVLRTAAFIAQARHAFDYALGLTREALALDPGDDQVRLLLASIHLVRGTVSEADRACRALRKVPPLVTATCHARVAVARNEIEPARSRLSALLAVVAPGSIPVEWYAWTWSVAGDLAAAAHDAAAAADCYERSLALLESTQVRAALVDALLEIGRLDHALEILDAGPPALPLTVRRLIVTTRLGSLPSSEEIVRVDREFERWIAAEDWLHAREMARFYLDVLERPALARHLALINLTLQREPEDMWLERRTRSLRPTRRDQPPSTRSDIAPVLTSAKGSDKPAG